MLTRILDMFELQGIDAPSGSFFDVEKSRKSAEEWQQAVAEYKSRLK